MDEFITRPVPEEDDELDQESLLAYFSDLLGTADGLGELADALDLGCDPPNSRASLDVVKIMQVSVRGDSIAIEYFVERSEYQACKDVNGTYSYDRQLTGMQIADEWQFKKHVYPESRSTHDEL